jgi:hypothetical protein
MYNQLCIKYKISIPFSCPCLKFSVRQLMAWLLGIRKFRSRPFWAICCQWSFHLWHGKIVAKILGLEMHRAWLNTTSASILHGWGLLRSPFLSSFFRFGPFVPRIRNCMQRYFFFLISYMLLQPATTHLFGILSPFACLTNSPSSVNTLCWHNSWFT